MSPGLVRDRRCSIDDHHITDVVRALVGGAVNARPLLFLDVFPDHPPTAVPFLEQLAKTHRVVAPWLRGYAPSPIVGPYDLDTLALPTPSP